MNEINKIPTFELFAEGHRACAGCGPAIVMRMLLKAAGKESIICQATGCMEVVSTPYPETSWKVPWIHVAFENAAAVASGVEAAMRKLEKKAAVIALAGDGGTFDIGFQALSGAVERGTNFTYVCYDNGAYMNTGIQRSGATPKYASTTTTPAGKKIPGKEQFKKNMPLIMAAHGAYVATANICFPQDFIEKVRKGIAFQGPSYIQVFAPCQTGWKYPSNMTIEIAKLAYQTKVTPLYEVEGGLLRFTRKVSTIRHIEEYLRTQGRFKHMSPTQVAEVQKWVDDEYNRLLKIEESQVHLS